ncbi:tetratricopeptide repeat protein [Kribbella sp. CA-294648]|uniref:tetratricopeptide repeat protein n=1 Tax=Kribbella sp. CA-294648 TaxID=3239948 RepID=UPI003D939ECA
MTNLHPAAILKQPTTEHHGSCAVCTTVQALYARARAHTRSGDYRAAEDTLWRALWFGEQSGIAELDRAVLLNELGVAAKTLGDHDRADSCFRAALDLAEEAGHDIFVTTVCHNLGGLAHSEGQYAEAERWARKAAELRTILLGSGHVEVAVDNAALAAILMELGRLDEASRLLRSALTTYEAAYGENCLEVAVMLNNFGALSHQLGMHALARQQLERALRIKEAVLGREHPEVAITLANLSFLNETRGSRLAAERHCRRAIAILTSTVGQTHPSLVACKSQLQRLTSGAKEG